MESDSVASMSWFMYVYMYVYYMYIRVYRLLEISTRNVDEGKARPNLPVTFTCNKHPFFAFARTWNFKTFLTTYICTKNKKHGESSKKASSAATGGCTRVCTLRVGRGDKSKYWLQQQRLHVSLYILYCCMYLRTNYIPLPAQTTATAAVCDL